MTRRANIWTLRDLRRALSRAKVSGCNVRVRLPREFSNRRIAVITAGGPVDLGIEVGMHTYGQPEECMIGRVVINDAMRAVDRAISKHGARAPIAVITDGNGGTSMADPEDGVLAVSESQLGDGESAVPQDEAGKPEAGEAANTGHAGDTGEGDARTPMDAGQMEEVGEPAAEGAGTPTDEMSAGGENNNAPAAADSAEEAGQDGESRATGSEAAGESDRDARGDAQQGENKTGGMGSAAASTGNDRAGAPDDCGFEHGLTGQDGAAQPSKADGEAGSPAGHQPDAATGMEDGRKSLSGAADEAIGDNSHDAADGAGTPDAEPADGEASGGADEKDAAGDASDTETHTGTRSGEDNDPALRERAAVDGGDETEAREVREDNGEPTDGGGYSPYGGHAMSEVAAAALRARGAARQASMEIERLLRKVLAPRGRRVPLVDERKLVHEVITRRYNISRARREQGRIRPIIITPDGSGSCNLMIKATLPAVEAIRRTLGRDAVQIVPNANGCPYCWGDDVRDWPEWLRAIADKFVSDYAYDGRPVTFWKAMLESGHIAAIIYIGDGDADHVWQQVNDRRVIAIRERYGDPDIGHCQTVDIRVQDDGDVVAYLREIARQIRAAKVQPV